MTTQGNRREVGFLAVLVAVCFGSAASAAYLDPNGWVGAQVWVDGPDVGIDDGRDINATYFTSDAAYYYFRMDLLGTPLAIAGQFSPEYSIYIDSSPGQGADDGGPNNHPYLFGTGLTGIDEMVDAHSGVLPPTLYNPAHYHQWNTGLTNFSVNAITNAFSGGAFQGTENGGTTLEWAIPRTRISSSTFTFWSFSTVVILPDVFDSSGPVSPTDDGAVPEPGTLYLMLTLGAVGLLFRPRRKQGNK